MNGCSWHEEPKIECKRCWLIRHDPEYNGVWSNTPTELHADSPPKFQSSKPPVKGFCKFLRSGDKIRLETCGSCGGKVQIAVLGCDVHGECTVAKKINGVSCCGKCPEFVAKS